MIPTKAKRKMVPPGTGEALHILGDDVISVLAGADTGGVYAVQRQESQPGGGPPLHRHSREDEGFTVLAGEYQF
jgi:quercetin dioxygenase-like cupin family protein